MQPVLDRVVGGIVPSNQEVLERARNRLDDLTKPVGSLGMLEDLVLRLSAMTGRVIPMFRSPQVLIFAADHGVSEAGVSAYDGDVTEQMAVNMCMGGAVSSVLARAQGVPLRVVDVGVKTRVRHPNVQVRKVACGTKNFAAEPAMTVAEARKSVEIGIEAVEACISEGRDLFVIGELGIGNTTSSTALLSAFLGIEPQLLVGEGTGISAEQKEAKRRLIEKAIQRFKDANPSSGADDPWQVFAEFGGFEIGAMAGAYLACAYHRLPVLLDGVITAAAALFAYRLNPAVADYLIASHQSPEPAHAYALKALGLQPLVQWGMRLGEASGALSILPVVRNACKVMAETATFGDARVSNPHRAEHEPLGPGEARVESPAATGAECTDGAANRSAAVQPTANDFDEAERQALYKAIYARRDIRSFLPDSIDDEVLMRILAAAHHGPSVGFMQPWNFILVRDRQVLREIQRVVERERVLAAEHYEDLQRDYYLRLKVEGLLQAPLTICVTNDPTRGGPHVLGRNTIPETDLMSTACAIENLWLAARVEGIGVGWVSIYQKADIRRILRIPERIDPVALLSIGYTAHFPEIPLLERVGWRSRLALQGLIYHDFWGNEEVQSP